MSLAEYDRHASGVPLREAPPFLSFYTPTFRRPDALARCIESVRTQTANDDLEQIIVPNHAGYGVIDSLYRRMSWYVDALRGRYVHVLCDDDELASSQSVASVREHAELSGYPPVIVVRAAKNGYVFPHDVDPVGEPVLERVDLSSYIVRRDVWCAHVADFGHRWCGDFDFIHALWRHHTFAWCDVSFVVGAIGKGRIEAVPC